VPAVKQQPPEVCVLYDPADRESFEELRQHLAPLERQAMMSLWEPAMIPPGSLSAEELLAHVRSARVTVLLLSAHFLSSPAMGELVSLAIERQRAGEALMLPVAVRRTALVGPLADYEIVPRQPVSSSPDRDEAWVTVVEALLKLLKDVSKLPVSGKQ
jgi:hypothetical protein